MKTRRINFFFLRQILTLSFLLGVATSFAQLYRPVKISLAEGLSQSTVYSIGQDSPGFLWVATQDGLNKYDGLNFNIFYNQPFDSTSLSSANISSVFCDSKNRLWIGTANSGVNLYNRSDNSFENFKSIQGSSSLKDNAISSITEDANGTIWVASWTGLNRLQESNSKVEKAKKLFVPIDFDADSVLKNITCVFAENDKLWIGAKNGLMAIQFQGNNSSKVKSIFNYTELQGLDRDEIRTIFKDHTGRLIVLTSTKLLVFDPNENRFIQVILNFEGNKNSIIYSAKCFSDRKIWIGTETGLFNLSEDSISIKNNLTATFKKINSTIDINVGAIISLSEDKINKGIIWAGTEANGLLKLVPVTKNFYSDNLHDILPVPFVFSILKDSVYVWIGTTNGLIRSTISNSKKELFTFSKNAGYTPNNYVNHLQKDQYGTYWVGTLMGLYQIDQPFSKHPEFKIVTVNPVVPNAGVRDIYFDGTGSAYVALPKKVFKLDLRNLKTELIANLDSFIQEFGKDVIFSSLVMSKDGQLYLGTNEGIILMDAQSKLGGKKNSTRIIQHSANDLNSLRSSAIYHLTADVDNSVWVGTSNGLSNVICTKTGDCTIKNYSTANGMKNNAVYTILLDNAHQSIWISTNGGLTRFNKQESRFYNFDLHDGLQSNEFNAGAAFQSSSGEMFFGGVNGYTAFYPSEIITDTVLPKIAITNFQILGKEHSIIPNGNEKLELNSDENSFSIEFIALQFSNPIKNKYAYRLEGFQKEWTNLGASNKVIFSNLPPGEFVFRVIGSNEDGLFNKDGAKIVICIKPPFYRTVWFYLALLFLAGSVLWLLHVYRLRFKMKQLAAIEKIRTDTASDFHDELGHKLTTISWFSEIVKRRLNPDQVELRTYLDKITGTTGALYHTMHDLLWAMDPGKDSLFDLYKQLREFGESLFDQTEINFSSMENDLAFKNDKIPFEQKRHVLLIFKEVMNNSFKHSKANSVSLMAYRENCHYTLVVADNGDGLDKDLEHKGNGLKNVYKRADVIKGELDIQSNTNGTKIKLSVPLNN